MNSLSLDSPLWQGISGLLAMGSIVAGFVIYKLQRPIRKLRCAIDGPKALLLSSSSSMALKITLDDREIVDPRVWTFLISNEGRSEVTRTDFAEPLSISFEGICTLYAVGIDRQSPPELGAQISIQENKISLSPLLLNQGDSLVLSAITSQSPQQAIPQVRARVSGMKAIQLVLGRDPETGVKAITTEVALSVGVALVLSMLSSYSAIRGAIETVLAAISR